MALGKRRSERQGEFWVAVTDLSSGPRHVFYEKLNAILAEADFDDFAEELCEPYYADGGRPSIPPGVYFRMMYLGYFEGIDSQRGIAWRCADSLSIRRFLGYRQHEATPDHSSLSRIRTRLPLEVFHDVHVCVLQLLIANKLVDGTTVGVDATLLEANAAMKSIVRKDNGEDWEEYVKRLAAEDGIEIKTKAELIRYDKQRSKEGKKKVSNDEWESPSDPDARIAKMKDGRTHLAYKAEHVVDLDTEAILDAEIYHANEGDTATLAPSLEQAQKYLDQAGGWTRDIKKVVADKGYHAAETLARCATLGWGCGGMKTYIPEPERKYEWSWLDRPDAQQQAVTNNHRRMQRAYGKRLQRRRSEVVERSFAHVCETGGGRRSWLRGIDEVRKRHLMTATAHNLGLVLRKLLGTGKVRQFGSLCAGVFVQSCGVIRRFARLGSCDRQLRAIFRKHHINQAQAA
tara:strand:- start:55 stop:1431 length:1377 start_codon:yes stop_codon:yes gene_type:complete